MVFRIRKVTDSTTPGNATAVRQVQAILRHQFATLDAGVVDDLPVRLRDPLSHRLNTHLLVAEGADDTVRGTAVVYFAPDLNFCFLDFLAIDPRKPGRGVGAALYERVRDEAVALRAHGLFFECLPDDPALSHDLERRKVNASRLHFYERFGARPIANTAYETPLTEGDDDPPYLVLDSLGRETLPGREEMRRIVRAILERKYAGVCSPDYVDRVVASFNDDPVVLRPQRYVTKRRAATARPPRPPREGIALIINQDHDIHHVNERGYVEAPVRIRSILKELDRLDIFKRVPSRRFSETHIKAVHDGRFVDYLKRACANVEPGQSIYPYVFPIRNQARPPRQLPMRAGYWCIDTFTPLNANAYRAARKSVDCALTAAVRVLEGDHLAYALIRPPGHHAEQRAFGGFCYFNNASIAANYLSRYGRVAVLDIDFHHGNGTQDIFYHRKDVLTVSLHGDPSFAYPFFSGFRDEIGVGAGTDFNLNIPLAEDTTPEVYTSALETCLQRIRDFDPHFLVLALGFDTARGDPTGTWRHRAVDFRRIGRAIGVEGIATVIVQEGGYRTRTLGINARNFFEGLWQGSRIEPPRRPVRATQQEHPIRSAAALAWRNDLREADVHSIRDLVTWTGVFSPEEIDVAAELVAERIAHGPASGYHFLIAETDGRVVGFTCFGPIPATVDRFDLYWIAVDPDYQGQGFGAELLRRTEAMIEGLSGVRIYVETSTGRAYAPTRKFYHRMQYRKAATLPDFYRNGDGKIIFFKNIAPTKV